MRYTLFLHYPETSAEDLGEDRLAEARAAFRAFAEEMEDAGVLVSAGVLQPSTSTTTLRVDDGVTRVLDGPHTDGREQIGGTIVVDVPDLDAALRWAGRCPAAAWGSVEVRPWAARYAKGAWADVR